MAPADPPALQGLKSDLNLGGHQNVQAVHPRATMSVPRRTPSMAPTHHPGQGRHRTRKGDKLHFQTCQGGRINCKSKDNVMILLGVKIIMYACLCFIHQPCEISINYICKLTMFTPIYCWITTHKNPVQLLVSLTNHSRYMKLPYGEQQICPGEALFSILWGHATLL